MYAIVQTGGKQYMVKEGDVLKVERLKAQEGETVDFDVLAISDNGSLKATDDVSSLKVTGKVIENGKSKKVIVFKYKAKKDYRRKKGHRQPFTKVEITSITA